MKKFSYKNGTVEDLLRDSESIEKMIGLIEPEKISSERWFRRKNLGISRLKLYDYFYIKAAVRNKIPFGIAVIEIRYSDKTAEVYFLPLAFVKGENKTESCFITVKTKDGIHSTIDALSFEPFLKFVNDCLDKSAILKGEKGSIVFEREKQEPTPYCYPINTNSTNTLVHFNYKSILKFIRKIEEGINVEYEMGEFLTRSGYRYSPPLEGGISYVGRDGRSSKIGIKFKEIDHIADGWGYTIDHLNDYFSFVAKIGKDEKSITEFLKGYLGDLDELAYVIANLHLVLNKDKEHERFRPEKISEKDMENWEESFFKLVKRSIDDAHKYVLDHPDSSHEMARVTLSIDLIRRVFEKLRKVVKNPGLKTRIHCDLHLGQVLKTKDGFSVIDFEGEPLRTIEERASKYSPLKDLAGMLRSFHYAAFASYFKVGDKSLEKYAYIWIDLVSKHFTRAYLDHARKLRISSVPYGESEGVKRLLALFKLEKAVYELCYELNNRPGWIVIPVEGIKSCLHELELF